MLFFLLTLPQVPRICIPSVFLYLFTATPFPSHSLVIHFFHASQPSVLSLTGVIVLRGTLKRDNPLAPNGVQSSLPCTLVIVYSISTIFLCNLLCFPVLYVVMVR